MDAFLFLRTFSTAEILTRLEAFARTLGGAAIGVADTEITREEAGFTAWLDAGFHGEMDYLTRNQDLRFHPEKLVPHTARVISVAFPYLPRNAKPSHEILNDPKKGYVARYALGRDYHKGVRQKLNLLADMMAREFAPHHYRVFSDSAPIREVLLAAKSGIGWRGKNTLLVSRNIGSFFFIGEILTDLPLPITSSMASHCGTCDRCLKACPTEAIIAPYQLDARRCISYLTIEHKGAIPIELRAKIGNRIFGCDDCQLICPWNRYAKLSTLPDWITPRHNLDDSLLLHLFSWDEATFKERAQGSAIYRIGFERWQRNIVVALGNALHKTHSIEILRALKEQLPRQNAMVAEHIEWAIHGFSKTSQSL